ncbi:MAG: TetR/AcrR family transcriptional regulator [Proteobacteria bacterium]|nr:TetR/AcrR family transcriptional regulator [Pseudomonadota bacterium]RTL40044.1 MAG: TetR/AcrR family transcriptional regulator [Rhodocyclaceae bacterium]
MKINEQEKERTRERILEAAVDVVSAKGFRTASMREIAQRAGVGDATIYNYFPSKEKLVYGYCEQVQRRVMAGLQGIADFHEYSLVEQLQQLVDLEMQTWLPAREFLREVFELSFQAPGAAHELLAVSRQLNQRMVVDLLDAAIEAGEIPAQPYSELLPRLFWDFQTGILAYWLKDDSEGFANTTQLLDRSMEIVGGILHLGLIGKAFDLISFLFRSHVLSHLESFASLRQAAIATKRRFMAGSDETRPA